MMKTIGKILFNASFTALAIGTAAMSAAQEFVNDYLIIEAQTVKDPQLLIRGATGGVSGSVDQVWAIETNFDDEGKFGIADLGPDGTDDGDRPKPFVIEISDDYDTGPNNDGALRISSSGATLVPTLVIPPKGGIGSNTNSLMFFGAEDPLLFALGSIVGLNVWGLIDLTDLDGDASICTGCRFPFQIENGAPTASIWVKADGNVGFGTASAGGGPLLSKLTVSDPNRASIFMDNGVDAWTFGADASLGAFIADGETALLNIQPNGNVGLSPGFAAPKARLHVGGTDDARLLVRNLDSTATKDRVMFELKNPSTDKVRFAITSGGNNTWTFDNSPTLNQFSISKAGTGANEFALKANGDGTFLGRSFAIEHVNTSSREAKTDFSEIDVQSILSAVAELPVSQWRYKQQGKHDTHVGPTAEDFQQAFGLGDGKTISTVDASGVALAAIKGLNNRLMQKETEIANLRTELDRQRNEYGERMIQLEMAVAEVLRNQSEVVQVSYTK